MIGVCIPAHDEEASVTRCVKSVLEASRHSLLLGEAVHIVVVADDCRDRTAWAAREAGAVVRKVDFRNVGAARAAGASYLMRHGARWLAFTDADSTVAPAWLVEQLAQGSDAVCGTVTVDDWTPQGTYGEVLAQHFAATYRDREDHRHIHGANLGVSAAAYVRAGGFPALASSEDVALVRALQASGAQIAWTARPRVTTSARRDGRATAGFADALTTAVRHIVARDSGSPVLASSVGVSDASA